MASDRMKLLILLLLAASPAIGQVRWITPGGVDLDIDVTGRVYILNGPAATVRIYDEKLDPVGEYGGPGWGEGQFDRPSGIWGRNGLDIFIADYGNHRIQRFDRQFNFLSALTTRDGEDAAPRFGYPRDVDFSRQGELFILDGENQQIVKVERSTRIERTFGGLSAGSGRLIRPGKMAIGPGDVLYVIDGERIVAFDAFGNFLRLCYEGVWDAPTAIAGTDDRLLVADGDLLTCCERRGGAVERAKISDLAPGFTGEVRAIGLHRGSLFLLGEKGCAILRDPWSTGEESVESEGKNP